MKKIKVIETTTFLKNLKMKIYIFLLLQIFKIYILKKFFLSIINLNFTK